MWHDFLEWIVDNRVLVLFLGAGGCLLTIAAAVSALTHSARVYFGVGALALGSGTLLLYYEILYADELLWAGALLVAFGGLTYLFAYLISLFVCIYRKKREYPNPSRGQEYALPDRNNDYIRARLGTALRTDGEELCPTEAPYSVSKTELYYARELLAKVREKELSSTDLLQAEEIGRLLAVYAKKQIAHPTDSRTINEGFSCLLKLAAKYSVAV